MEINFPKQEKQILKFWKQTKAFEKSIGARKNAPNFVFYEGPPTSNAKPGIHHILARAFKDIICRYKTMQGFLVKRRAGWDTHGLPVELEVEKKLGLKNKKDIEKYGIAEFNKECKKSVWRYKKDWEKMTDRIGFWLDAKNPYITYETNYIETVWWILKQIYKKGLAYRDYKVIPYCPRCQTGLSSHEVALGYKSVKEESVFVKFKIKSANARWKNVSILSWTTTPWTLPGNVALAVNPKLEYVCVPDKQNPGHKLVLGIEHLKNLSKKGIFGDKYEKEFYGNSKNIKTFLGAELKGLEYEPLFKSKDIPKPAYRVILADFVLLGEGTGVVHIAPAFGEEDMGAGKENDLPILLNVDEEGKFQDGHEPWSGMFVKEGEPLIIEKLSEKNALLKTELYEHDYPFCWRCGSPLLYYAKKCWFINMKKAQNKLLGNNQKINWVPAYLKNGRMGEWLKEVKDWAFSRERFWGTPLPVWLCENCAHTEVVGGLKDLLSQKFSNNKYYILRHGQTPYQTEKKGTMYPWPEKLPVRLTKEGEKQAERAAKRLKSKKIDVIYASDVFRVRQTAGFAAQKTGVKIIFDKRLRDLNLGSYHGNPKEKFYKDFPSPLARFYGKKPRQGENWGECRKRMVDFLNDIDSKHKNKTILIVSHGDPLWLLEGAMKGWNDERLLKNKAPNNFIKTGESRQIKFKKLPLNETGKIDFHRPYIDKVEFSCSKCKGKMKRASEVLDCWFDSGAMPFAQAHFPFNLQSSNSDNSNYKNLVKKIQFPADFISEAVDQTRGWFYTLLAISTLLDLGAPYKNVVSLGHILDEKGEKMSKSKGNVVDPFLIIDKYGVDAVRWYFYAANQPGDPKLFSEKDLEGILKKFILTLWNSFLFFETYGQKSKMKIVCPARRNLLDKWIVSKLGELINEVSVKLDKYDITSAARSIESFVIDDLSQWYIRRSRRRFQKPRTTEELKDASRTLSFVFLVLSELIAPFIPFLGEQIYQKIHSLRPGPKSSVHLEKWPKIGKESIDKNLIAEMDSVREIVALALAERAKAKIKIRQPLNSLEIQNCRFHSDSLDLIKEEVNVKEIVFGKSLKLDTEITPELKKEGMVRDVLRHIQEMRKIARFKPKDKILIRYSGEAAEILSSFRKYILEETGAKSFMAGRKPKETFKVEREINIDGQALWLGIKKI